MILQLYPSHATTTMVRRFLDEAGSSLRYFRYYEKRDIHETIAKHALTVMAWGDNFPVGYGHLTADGWLGVCVTESRIGTGIGKSIMEHLIEHGTTPVIHLHVDHDNERAQHFYRGFGFKEIGRDDHGIVMTLDRAMKEEAPMADSFGSLVDKLATVNQKMFLNQEFIYAVRRMSFEQFQMEYLKDQNTARNLYESIKKCCDLNMQRVQLVNEVDEKLVELLKAASEGKNLDDGKNIQRAHKTY